MSISMPQSGSVTRKQGGLFLKGLFVALGLAALVYIARPQTASADIPIAYDDFEDPGGGPTGYGWAEGWDLDGNTGYRSSDFPKAGSYHLRLRSRGAEAVRSADVSGDELLQLSLWARVDDADTNDIVIAISNDGVNFTEIDRWDVEGGPYTYYEYDLSSYTFDDQIWFRAHITGSSSHDGEVFIDELKIVSLGQVPDDPPVTGGALIEIDGQFDDWDGKSMLADPDDDQEGSSRRDIAALYWANNPDEEVNYHMIERYTTNGQPFNGNNGQDDSVSYILYIDGNNSGGYGGSSDRKVYIYYSPTSSGSYVRVKAFKANSWDKVYDSGWNDWGESRSEGGLRVEFGLDWDDLGLDFGEVIRMYAVSYSHYGYYPSIRDRVPDGNADIQWSPASVLGPWLLAGAGVLGMVLIWYISKRRRLWT